MRKSAHMAVQKRYARWPMASPRAKYSNSASRVTKATARATIAVEPHSTRPTTTGISTAAVATRFHVIEQGSPGTLGAPSHHIEGNKSRRTITNQRKDSFTGYASRFLHSGVALADSAVAALPILEFDERFKQPRPVEIGPERFRDEDLGVGDLPEQKIAYAHFPARANEEIRVRQTVCIHVPGQQLFRDRRPASVPVLLCQDGIHGIDDFRAPAVIQGHAQHHAGICGRLFHGIANIVLHADGKLVGAAEETHADIVFLQQRHLPAEVFAQELHQEVDFRFWPAPVLNGKRVEREGL